MNLWQIVCSNESGNSLISGTVQMKYVSLFLKPAANAENADFGLVSAIFDKSCRWLFKLVTSSLTYFFYKDDFQLGLKYITCLPMLI